MKGTTPRLLAATISLCVCASAQWLNYTEPGTPRLKDGKVNLNAPVPRLNGKPDLTGVWAHEITPAAEFKRILGAAYETESRSALIGMELESVHKYALNIFADFKPTELPMRPEGEAMMKKRSEERRVGKEGRS